MPIFRSSAPTLTTWEDSEGNVHHLDGLPVNVQAESAPGWLLVEFPTLGIEEYPVREDEIEYEEDD